MREYEVMERGLYSRMFQSGTNTVSSGEADLMISIRTIILAAFVKPLLIFVVIMFTVIMHIITALQILRLIRHCIKKEEMKKKQQLLKKYKLSLKINWSKFY